MSAYNLLQDSSNITNVTLLGEALVSYLSDPEEIDDTGLSATASLLKVIVAPNGTSEEVDNLKHVS